MGGVFVISWPRFEKAVEAELLEEQDPKLCQDFWDALPFRSIQSHAVCAGVQMYCPFRLVSLPSHPFYEPMNEQPVGRVNLELDFQYMAINYGPMREPVPALPIAQIEDNDIEEIKIMGKMAWDNLLFSDEFLMVLFDKKEGAAD